MFEHNYRLYSFAANLYLSPLQCGLQTAHVVSELSLFKDNTDQAAAFRHWALMDKTIIICGALHHGGVVECYEQLCFYAPQLKLPVAIFREDDVSMNRMATACGVIVPEKYWSVTFCEGDPGAEGPGNYQDHWEYRDPATNSLRARYPVTGPEGQFISLIKSYKLA